MKSRHLIVFFAATVVLLLIFFRSPLHSLHSGVFTVNVLQEAAGDCPDLDLHFSPDSIRPVRLQGTVSLFGERVPLEALQRPAAFSVCQSFFSGGQSHTERRGRTG